MSIRQYINEMYGDDIYVFDNPSYDSAIIGITSDDRVVYDYDLMVEELAETDNISYEEAMEFIDYNTVRALSYFSYENKPVIIFPINKEMFE